MNRKIRNLIYLLIIGVAFIPFIGVKAATINEVTVRVTLPNVGDLVLPEGYTGTDYDNIVDDGTSDPTLYPTVTSLTDGVIVKSTYYVVSATNVDELFFGQFKKGDTAYIEVYIEGETNEYQLADDLTINVQYTKGLTNYTVSPAYQDTIHVKSGYNIYYTDFSVPVPVLNKFTVTFDSKGGSPVDSQELIGSGATESATITKPANPTKDDYDFKGWYTDTDCTDGNEFDFSVSVSSPMTLYAKWEESTQEYVLNSGDNTVTFTYDKGYNFALTFVDVLKMQVADLSELYGSEMTGDMYYQMYNQVLNNTKEYGNLIGFYVIEVSDKTVDPNHDYTGSVKVKVKLTDDMKKYDSFKYIYLDDDNNFQVGEIVDFKVEGNYLVGTLPHLSSYALVGNLKTNNPNTGDNMMVYISLFGLSLTGLYIMKKRFN